MIGFELIYAAFVWGWVDNRGVYMSYMYIGYSISIMEEAEKTGVKAAHRYALKTKSHYLCP